ncbi:alpha/beta hydrolase [Paenibacillus sp. XY044]|uniref:alpha/beta hydrolase n=1 Tax=Paenibacillus sp. XY044 TaxID=2026089 RepID=UPI000B999CDC|nr:alpha/beta hydrolase [Paenibacillus sp. XY044]OZB91251.1 alpha/beta hydrolase [Paenibacillus sp. XY044]
MNIHGDYVQGYKDRKISYTVLSKTESKAKGLAIIFPGQGYTAQAPLLYYSTGIYLNQNYDVLQVNYQYNDPFYREFGFEEIAEAIRTDVGAVIDHALQNASYDDYALIGKSIGTIALGFEVQRELFRNAKVIWFTPLLGRDFVWNAMMRSKQRGLCFIGDNDSCYIEERFQQLRENPKLTLRLIPGVNHGLEYETDLFPSLDVLKQVMKEVEAF